MFIKMVFVVVFGFPDILQITKECFNEHRCPILNPSGSYIQTAISEHFMSNSLSVSHILLIPIETLTCRYITGSEINFLIGAPTGDQV